MPSSDHKGRAQRCSVRIADVQAAGSRCTRGAGCHLEETGAWKEWSPPAATGHLEPVALLCCHFLCKLCVRPAYISDSRHFRLLTSDLKFV